MMNAWKYFATVIGSIGGTLSIIATWMALGFWTPASRDYVNEKLRPVIYQQLKVRRHVNAIDLFQWQQNPQPWSQGIRERVDELKTSIRDLDRQIAVMER